MIVIEILFFFVTVLLIYSYIGYPLVLHSLGRLMPKREDPQVEPAFLPVSIILSVYNEEGIIKEKINNFSQLDYHSDKLELIIVSDGSTDRTNEIVLSYNKKSINLIIQPERCGKTMALNKAVKDAKGEILVFTDADVIFPGDTIKKLMRRFTEKDVGLITGTSWYRTSTGDNVPNNNAYWRYENLLKRLESRVGGVVGANGSVYALRKDLYRELPPDIINDFAHPIEVVLQDKMAILDPEVICYEGAAAGPQYEYDRQVRMVGQAFLVYRRYILKLLRKRKVLYAFLLTSHKLIRWFTIPLMLAMLVFNLMLWNVGSIYPALCVFQLLFYLFVLLGPVFRSIGLDYRMLTLPFDFCFMNLAVIFGVYRSFSGTSNVIWEKQRV